MVFLRFLEELRTPFGDAFFSAITHLGTETVFILSGLIFFWCIDKKEGYYILSVGFIGTVVNQFLKLFFRIPRPWVKDESFTVVESATAEATGYSFPSGHTQSSVGLFGSMARWNKKPWIRMTCILICVLVPFSRMYLGVHTLQDVIVSMAIALILVFGLYPIIRKATEVPKRMRAFLIMMVILSVGLLLFVNLYNFPADTDAENLASGMKNAYKMFGCTLGIFIVYEVDRKYINFETAAPLPAQILKFVLGLIPAILIKEGLRIPLSMIFGEKYISDGITYLVIVIFAGCVWPLTFRRFAGFFKKNEENDNI